ncbi:MAG TPA: hypothetical protein VG796_16360 [Verrucomicrobiales bacterium]|jgi:hypothetical protein|nr:hypothetical protein [Verrucomicrobiales bacterium]
MPLTSDESYVEVMREYLAHWSGTDELTDLVLPGGVSRTELGEMGTELAGIQESLQELEDELAHHANETLKLKTQLRDRLVQFNVAARTWYEDRPEGKVVPQVETLSAAPDRFCRPVRDALRLWDVMNDGAAPAGLTLPLLLQEGFSRDDLAALMDAYQNARLTHEDTEFQCDLIRANRDQVQDWLRETLVAYNRMVTSQFGTNAAVTDTLPQLFPTPGGIADPVELQAAWDSSANQAILTWEPSTAPRLKGYQIRCLPGPEYQRRGSRLVANIPRDGALECLTADGLDAPGTVASYCLYVVQERGRHRGSKPVTIRRTDR